MSNVVQLELDLDGTAEKFFRRDCQLHDYWYEMSDDPRWYWAGAASEERLRESTRFLTREQINRIWQEVFPASEHLAGTTYLGLDTRQRG